jgi:hypothetical protein
MKQSKTMASGGEGKDRPPKKQPAPVGKTKKK